MGLGLDNDDHDTDINQSIIMSLGLDNVDKDTELVVPGIGVLGEDLAHHSVPQGQTETLVLRL